MADQRHQLALAPGLHPQDAEAILGILVGDTLDQSREHLAIRQAFVPVPVRSVIWIIALIWMGTACILNARRCGRTHCRYTGPYYLAMIAPVLVLASSIISAGFYGWLGLGVLIFAGGKIIWWATE